MKKPDMEIVRQIEAYEPAAYLSTADAQRLKDLYNAAPHWRVGIEGTVTFAVTYSQAVKDALKLAEGERIQVNFTQYTRLLDEIKELTDKATAAFAETRKNSPAEVLKALQREASRIIKEAREPVRNQAKGLGLTQGEAERLANCPPEPPAPNTSFDTPEYGKYLDLRFFSDVFSDDVLRDKTIKAQTAHLTQALEAAGTEWAERGRTAIDDVISRKWKVRAPQPIQKRAKLPALPSAGIYHSNHKAVDALFYGPGHRELIETGSVDFVARKGNATFLNTLETIDAAKAALIKPEDRPVYDALEEIVMNTVLERDWLGCMYPLPVALEVPIGAIFRRESWNPKRHIDKQQFDRIVGSLLRIKGTHVVLHCVQEADAWGFDWKVREEDLLEGSIELHGGPNGSDGSLYLLAVPLLTRYSLQTGKYYNIDPRFIYRDVPMQSPRLRAARNYLLRCIADGYTYKKRTVTVKVADLAAAAGISPSDGSMMTRLRKGAERQLGAWAAPDTADKSERQYINRFIPYIQGRAVAEYQIVLRNLPKEAFTPQGIETPETWQDKKLSRRKQSKNK